MVKNRVPFEAVGAEEYEAKRRERELTRLKRQAAKLGYTLTPRALEAVGASA